MYGHTGGQRVFIRHQSLVPNDVLRGINGHFVDALQLGHTSLMKLHQDLRENVLRQQSGIPGVRIAINRLSIAKNAHFVRHLPQIIQTAQREIQNNEKLRPKCFALYTVFAEIKRSSKTVLFQRGGGVHKTHGFWNFFYRFLKIKRPGRLFQPIR